MKLGICPYNKRKLASSWLWRMGIRNGEEYTTGFHDIFIELIFKTTQIGDFGLKSNY